MKKLVSFLLLISLLFTVGSITAFADNGEHAPGYWIAEIADIDPELLPGTVIGIMGDSDLNSKVNVKDATAIQKHVADVITLDETAVRLSDSDLSDNVNVKDATTIQKWITGIIPAEESYIGHYYYKAYDLDERLLGKWDYTYDVGAQINYLFPILMEDPAISDYINIKSCVITETFEFFDDYSFEKTTDEEALLNAIETIKPDLANGIINYSIAVLKESGYEITAEELLKSMGYSSAEEYIDDVYPIESVLDATSMISHYRTTPDGKIYLDEFSDIDYNLYTVTEDTITITSGNDNITPGIYPIVLKKAN